MRLLIRQCNAWQHVNKALIVALGSWQVKHGLSHLNRSSADLHNGEIPFWTWLCKYTYSDDTRLDGCEMLHSFLVAYILNRPNALMIWLV